jgi:hypothetical protein
MKYYTFQVHITSGGLKQADQVLEFKDIEESMMHARWKEIFKSGVKVQSAPLTWEIISPFRIRTVFIVEQPFKYTTT